MNTSMSIPIRNFDFLLVFYAGFILFCSSFIAIAQEGAHSIQYTHAKVITPQGTSIEVEIADTIEKRRLGLSFRTQLPHGKGMLFIFNDKKKHSFWMKNMLIPLDILWMDNHRIVHIEHATAPLLQNETPRAVVPDKKANFVLEIAAGQAKVLNLKVGQKLKYQF